MTSLKNKFKKNKTSKQKKQIAGTRRVKNNNKKSKNKTYKKNQKGGTWGGFLVGTGFGGLLYKWFSMRN